MVVVETLDELATNYGDSKAAGHRDSITKFTFIVTLVAVEHVLSTLTPLSKLLQDKSCDLIDATSESRIVFALLQVSFSYNYICYTHALNSCRNSVFINIHAM